MNDTVNLRKGKLSNEQRTEIIKLYQEGIGSEILAKQFNVSGQCILKLLKRMNVEIRPKIQKVFKKDEDKIIQMYNAGFSAEKISEKFEVNKTVVLRILIKNNIERRSSSECHFKRDIDESIF